MGFDAMGAVAIDDDGLVGFQGRSMGGAAQEHGGTIDQRHFRASGGNTRVEQPGCQRERSAFRVEGRSVLATQV